MADAREQVSAAEWGEAGCGMETAKNERFSDIRLKRRSSGSGGNWSRPVRIVSPQFEDTGVAQRQRGESRSRTSRKCYRSHLITKPVIRTAKSGKRTDCRASEESRSNFGDVMVVAAGFSGVQGL